MLSIVLPAYNEAAGLPDLLGRVGRTMAAYGRRYQIIVVDDGSTDGTASLAEAAGAFVPVKLVRHRANGGLGRALRTGLLAALGDSAIIVTMDADNSHDPELIPLMAERLERGYDIVVASRFQEGGQEVGVALHRRALSHTASMLLRRAFPLDGVRDYSSGFRAYRADLLRRLVERWGEAGLVEERGFACMLEVLLKAGALGARVCEVPLVLRYDRKQGASKMRIVRTVRRYGVLMGQPRIRPPDRARASGARRALNLTLAAVGVTLAAPLLALLALLIKLTSPGPVLYTQTRVGLDRRRASRTDRDVQRAWDYGGKPFTLYRFRTMRMNHGTPGGAAGGGAPDDSRVTPLGRMLRKYRLDELPQLFNVLRGDMNLVGPRPERPHIVEHLARRIKGYRERHRVLPGITGWAQVNSHDGWTFDDVRRQVVFDLEYVARQSVVEDLRIMLRSVPVALLTRGAWQRAARRPAASP